MKSTYLLIAVVSFLMPATAYGQQFNEWFNQKKTQIQYLVKQIAELQVYLGYVKKGYKIVSGGLNTINDIKNGEFKLHDLYYKSLELVNPRIRNSPKVKEIIRHQIYILKVCEELRTLVSAENSLSHSLQTYVDDVVNRLLDGVEFVRKDLVVLTTDASLKMTDSERLSRLGELYEMSKGQFVFAQKFSSETITMIKSVQQEQRDDRMLKELHDL